MYRKTYEYDAITVDASVICVECAEEEGIEGHPVFIDSEWDYYPSCDKCGCVIESINFLSAQVDDSEKPILKIDYGSGVARLSAVDEYGNSFVSYDRDALAGECNFCELCGIIVEHGWVCLDGGEIYCDNCIIEEDN